MGQFQPSPSTSPSRTSTAPIGTSPISRARWASRRASRIQPASSSSRRGAPPWAPPSPRPAGIILVHRGRSRRGEPPRRLEGHRVVDVDRGGHDACFRGCDGSTASTFHHGRDRRAPESMPIMTADGLRTSYRPRPRPADQWPGAEVGVDVDLRWSRDVPRCCCCDRALGRPPGSPPRAFCAPSRSFWATPTSPPPRSTPTSTSSTSPRSTTRPTRGPAECAAKEARSPPPKRPGRPPTDRA